MATQYRTKSGSDWILDSTNLKGTVLSFVECQHPVATAPGSVLSGSVDVVKVIVVLLI